MVGQQAVGKHLHDGRDVVGKKAQKVAVVGLLVKQIAAVHPLVVDVVRAPKLELFHCPLLP